MEFTGCIKERFALTLKSSLLCAAMLTPAAALAESPEASRSEEPVQTAMVADADTDTADVDTDFSTATTPAEQRKIARLSGHIQREYRLSETKARRIVREAVHNGARHQVEPELILAIIAVESTFNERAVSRVGARGLMQVMPGAHTRKVRDIGGSHALFDPARNIHTGSRILAQYLDDSSGNLRRALLSYNGSLSSRSSFPEKVLRIYRGLQRATTEG